jgi:hypothetical protein
VLCTAASSGSVARGRPANDRRRNRAICSIFCSAWRGGGLSERRRRQRRAWSGLVPASLGLIGCAGPSVIQHEVQVSQSAKPLYPNSNIQTSTCFPCSHCFCSITLLSTYSTFATSSLPIPSSFHLFIPVQGTLSGPLGVLSCTEHIPPPIVINPSSPAF